MAGAEKENPFVWKVPSPKWMVVLTGKLQGLTTKTAAYVALYTLLWDQATPASEIDAESARARAGEDGAVLEPGRSGPRRSPSPAANPDRYPAGRLIQLNLYADDNNDFPELLKAIKNT